MKQIISLYEKRRSIYRLGSKLPVTEDQLRQLIVQCLKQAPSSFNSQSARIVVLLKGKHLEFWQLVKQELQKIVPAKKFAPTEEKIASFSAGYGTIVFFEDKNVIKEMQKKYPLYKDDFPDYALQSSGMLQYMIWTAFAAKNIGASLQHYNQLIEIPFKEKFAVPSSWKMISQMPFGNIIFPADEKTFEPLEKRIKILS